MIYVNDKPFTMLEDLSFRTCREAWTFLNRARCLKELTAYDVFMFIACSRHGTAPTLQEQEQAYQELKDILAYNHDELRAFHVLYNRREQAYKLVSTDLIHGRRPSLW